MLLGVKIFTALGGILMGDYKSSKIRRTKTKNDSDVIVSEYFTSVYKFWSDGSFRTKYLYNNKGELINVFEYTYENEDSNGKYF